MVKLLLLGSDINAYYMGRCYHELYGVKAQALGNEKMRFTMGTSIIDFTYNDELQNKDKFVSILLDYYKEHYSDEKVLLVPCHDVYVRLVVENRKKLEKYYVFNSPDIKIMDSFLVKEKFYTTYSLSAILFVWQIKNQKVR